MEGKRDGWNFEHVSPGYMGAYTFRGGFNILLLIVYEVCIHIPVKWSGQEYIKRELNLRVIVVIEMQTW